jgi:hypothetical protein
VNLLPTIVACGIVAALLVSLGFIGFLAVDAARPIPDALITTASVALGYLGGILTPTPGKHRRNRKETP